jgi:hypothetical protein
MSKLYLVLVVLMVGEGDVEVVLGYAGLFEEPLSAQLLVAGDDLPHVERRVGHPRATAALRPAERYAGMPLRPRHLFGGSSEALVLGCVQDDAYAVSALVDKVARFHAFYYSSRDRSQTPLGRLR